MPGVNGPADTTEPVVSVSLAALFFGFVHIGLTGFGGVLPWAHRLIVERQRWLSVEEFTATLAIGQFMPGPNVINLSVLIGARFQGRLGALVAPLGLIIGPFLIVLGLGALYQMYGDLPQVQAMLRGISAVGAGLIAATGIKMAKPLRRQRAAMLLLATTFVAIAWLRLPLPPLMLTLAPLGIYLAHCRARRDEQA